MNQAQTTYRSDYSPFDWFQNNVISENEFCSVDNVDECLKYISQEFSALGYPSIYSHSSDSPSAVNCDIVKFLNVSFELLRSNNQNAQIKEDLESRNQRLSSDIHALNKKNSLLKASLEQNERKLASALERERQMKEKLEHISQQLKTEKEENKKLATQLRQQKVAYQHELRKHENNLNQVKARLNQLLSDKNPNKKIASISMSQTLPRNSGPRGKWKTGSAASTAMEEMYNSVLSSYETRSKDLARELNSFRHYMQSVLLNIVEIVSQFQNEVDGKVPTTSEEFLLNQMKKESRDIQGFEEKFKYLFSVLQQIVLKKDTEIYKNLKDEVADLKLKLSKYEEISQKHTAFQQGVESPLPNNTEMLVNKMAADKMFDDEILKKEKMKLDTEKLALSKSLENIEKEKAELSAQKLAVLRLALQQKLPIPSWHEGLSVLPSISVITSENGSTLISSPNLLKSCLSTPEYVGMSNTSFSPEYISAEKPKTVFHSKSDSGLTNENLSISQSTFPSPVTPVGDVFNSDLPSWAVDRTQVQSVVIDDTQNTAVEMNQNVSTDEIDLPNESSSEEISLMRLKAAVQDIENRRSSPS